MGGKDGINLPIKLDVSFYKVLQSIVYCPFQDFFAPIAVLIAVHSAVDTAIKLVPLKTY
jgi:hypothetical protein